VLEEEITRCLRIRIKRTRILEEPILQMMFAEEGMRQIRPPGHIFLESIGEG